MEASILDNRRSLRSEHSVLLRPPAKINLSLVVFDRRPDSFHELHTIMAAVELHDDLHLNITSKPGIILHCTGRPCPTGQENIVYKAAEMLAQHANIKPALEINLHKRIPAQAGLGGGSSDAASCLMGLNHLWKLNLSIDELARLAIQLGSDVPFFLYGPVAVCTGKGEIVPPLPHRCRRPLLLVIPDVSAPTATVYEKYCCDEANNEDHMRRVRYFLRTGDLDGLVIQGINSLTCTCMQLFGPLDKLRHKIESMGIGPLHVSGSGSCLFATAESSQQTKQWAQQLNEHKLAQALAVNFHDHAESYLEVPNANI